MKQCLSLIAIGAIALNSLIAGEDVVETGNGMTLNEAIIAALAHDPTIARAHADVSEAEGFAKEVKADLLPQLSVEGRAGAAMRDRDNSTGASSDGDFLFSRRASVIGRQSIWDGGFNWYRWKDAKQRIQAREYLELAQRENTAIKATEAFLDVLRARKQLGLSRESVTVHQSVLDLAKKRAEAAGNQADIELSTARHKLARTLVMERQLALRQADATFARWVGIAPPRLIWPDVPEISSIGEIDSKQNYHYIATLRQHEAATLEKKALTKKYGPQFFLEASAGVGRDTFGIKGKDNDASVLVVGSWDIFDGGRRKGKIMQAAADIDRQLAIMEETIVLLDQDILSRWEDYRTIDSRLNIVRDYSDALNKTVTLYQQQFDLGTRPLLSLLDIQNEVIAASVRVSDGNRDRALLAYRLLFFGGRLIRETVGDSYLQIKSGSTSHHVATRTTESKTVVAGE